MIADVALPVRTELPPAGGSIHMMGVGGAGMRGLAQLLVAEGYRVSGCDRRPGAGAASLRAEGIEVCTGHDPSHIDGYDLLIHTAAIPAGHPELCAATRAGVPVMKRARATGALFNARRLLAVAGTHGKTTITAMAALACEAGGLDPMALAGGRVPSWGGYARRGGGEVAVVEADEFDRSFLQLDPDLAIVSSIEPEHMECYGSEAQLREAFLAFASRAQGREGALLCVDRVEVREVAPALGACATYGFAEDAEYRVESLAVSGGEQKCRLSAPDGCLDFTLGTPGAHNAQNAAAALGAALMLGVEASCLEEALAGFRGVERRLQRLGERDGVVVIDDYAHHPTEVRASIAAVRQAYPGRRLVAVLQPHLYSRVRAMAAEFAEAMGHADAGLVLPIFAAREKPLEDVSARRIVAHAPARITESTDVEVLEEVRNAAGSDAVFLFMGAGDVTELAARAATGGWGDDLDA